MQRGMQEASVLRLEVKREQRFVIHAKGALSKEFAAEIADAMDITEGNAEEVGLFIDMEEVRSFDYHGILKLADIIKEREGRFREMRIFGLERNIYHVLRGLGLYQAELHPMKSATHM